MAEAFPLQCRYPFGDDYGFEFLSQSEGTLGNTDYAGRYFVRRNACGSEGIENAIDDDTASVFRDMVAGKAFQRCFIQ